MTEHSQDDALGKFDAAAERRSFASAREHVGAAGLAQHNSLEHIIASGQEQIIVTQSLRQVVASTLAQLNALPLAELGSSSQTHIEALRGIVASGQAQLQRADNLRQIIQRALVEFEGTPLEHVSAHVLTVLMESVERQAAGLENIIAAAIGEANSLEQIAQLKRTSEEAIAQLLKVKHGREEQALAQLDMLGAEARDRIRSLEAAGETHAVQRVQLEQDAETAKLTISALVAAEAEDRAEIVSLEQQNEMLDSRIEELEGRGSSNQEKLEGLRGVPPEEA